MNQFDSGDARIALFYRNPRLTVLFVAVVFIAGLSAWQGIARQEDPTMTERFGDITIFLPGATAERVEALVSEPVERALRQIPEVQEISSISRAGYALINLEFDDAVGPDEVTGVWSEVRDEVDKVDLPVGAGKPQIEERFPIAATLIVALRADGDAALGVVSRLADELAVRLSNLPGTMETQLYGEVDEEVLVTVDAQRLAMLGLAAADVAARIAAADAKVAGGQLRNAASDLLVDVAGELDSLERIAAIPVTRAADGAMVRLSSLADVRKHRVDPPRTMALVDGRRSVVVSAVMEPDQRIDLWMDGARTTVDTFQAQLPPSVALQVLFDQNVYTGGRLATLALNLASALAIVMGILLFFMGVRAAVTVGVALPLSMAMVLVGLHALDVPLHQMSVTGLIISLGLLIDNAIVVVEEYKLRRRRGAAIDVAIGSSVRRLAVPLFASTATTILAFLPIPLTPGGTGEFTGTIGISVILAVASSFLLAMTVVPACAGFIERRFPLGEPGGAAAGWARSGYRNATMAGLYARSLDAVLRRPLLGVGVGLALPLLGFALAPTLTMQFFPPVDRNQFQVQITLPAHASIHATAAQLEVARALIGARPAVTGQVWFVGEGAPRVFYNVMNQNDGVSSFAAAFVTTTSAAATAELLPELQRELMASLPGARVLALPFEQGPPFSAPIEVRISGPDRGVLRELGEQVRLVMAGVDGVTYTDATLAGASPKLALHANEFRTAAAGLGVRDLPAQLAAALTGQTGGTVLEGTEELPVRVRVGDTHRATTGDLLSLPIAGPTGVASLDSLARLELEPSASSIERFQGVRTNTVQGFLMPFALPAPVLARFERALAERGFQLPPGYTLGAGGEAEQRSESVGNLLATFAVFATLMLAVVVLSLNSFRHAAVIGLVGLLSVGLALLGVRLFGYPLGFTALIGTLGLVGLAINGAIIVLTALAGAPECRAGAVAPCRTVVIDSTRHIVSTTVTTIGGFIPLILFGGTFWPPLATAIAGGVAGSALLALYLVPALYAWLARRGQRAVDAGAGSGAAVADQLTAVRAA